MNARHLCLVLMETLPMPAHLLVAEMLGLAPTARFLSALSKTSRARDVVGRWTRQGRNVPVTWREGSGEEEDSTDDEEVTVPVLEQSSPAAAEVVDLFKQVESPRTPTAASCVRWRTSMFFSLA